MLATQALLQLATQQMTVSQTRAGPLLCVVQFWAVHGRLCGVNTAAAAEACQHVMHSDIVAQVIRFRWRSPAFLIAGDSNGSFTAHAQLCHLYIIMSKNSIAPCCRKPLTRRAKVTFDKI